MQQYSSGQLVKVLTLNSGFKISGDATKPARLLLRIRPPVCKRKNESGIKTVRIRHESRKISSSVHLVLIRVDRLMQVSENSASCLVYNIFIVNELEHDCLFCAQ